MRLVTLDANRMKKREIHAHVKNFRQINLEQSLA